MPARLYRVSLYSGRVDSKAKPYDATLDELISALTEHETRTDKDGPAWSPTRHDPPVRAVATAQAVCALVYDLDNGLPVDWQPSHLAIAHSTHTPGRWRVVYPLATDVAPADFAALWELVASSEGLSTHVDRNARDVARLSYLPSAQPGIKAESRVWRLPQIDPKTFADEYKPIHLHSSANVSHLHLSANVLESGEIADPPTPESNGFPEKHAFPPAIDLSLVRLRMGTAGRVSRTLVGSLLNGTMRLMPGERNDTLHKTMAHLSAMDPSLSDEAVESLLRPVLAQSEVQPEGLEHWLRVAMFSWARGKKHAQQKQSVLQATKAWVESKTPPADFVEDSSGWKVGLLMRTNKDGEETGLEACGPNVELILENDPNFKGHLRYNELTHEVECTSPALLGVKNSSLDAALANWLHRSDYHLRFGRAEVWAQAMLVAERHAYNPVRDYLKALTWDGKERLNSFFADDGPVEIAATMNAEVASWYARKFFIAAVARVLQPGCQVDTVLLLHGEQGVGKTQLLRALADPWVVHTHVDAGSKDSVMATGAGWIVELGEMASLRKGEHEVIRNFISTQEDTIRLPYGRGISRIKRQSVFVATTNSEAPLSDPDGQRRWWPLTVTGIDLPRIREMRDQLWAEAVVAYEKGEPWWLDEVQRYKVKAETAMFESVDFTQAIELEVRSWYLRQKTRPTQLTLQQILRGAFFKSPSDPDYQKLLGYLGRGLRRMGWRKTRTQDITRQWVYEPPLELREANVIMERSPA